MLKRLLRKIGNINLQHATTFENLINIFSDGAIKPYNDTNKTRRSNSLDGDSIYLTRNLGVEFAYDFWSDDKYKIGVCINVNVDEKNLLPSYDFKEFEVPNTDYKTGEEYWEKSDGTRISSDEVKNINWEDSLDIAQECRYKGQILINNIINIILVSNDENIVNKIGENKFLTQLNVEEVKNIINLVK